MANFAMVAHAFASLAVVTLSPAAVLLWTVVLPKPELIILAIGSAFVWLLAIVVCAALWWATAALDVLPRLALTVALGVVVQEASRGLAHAATRAAVLDAAAGIGDVRTSKFADVVVEGCARKEHHLENGALGHAVARVHAIPL